VDGVFVPADNDSLYHARRIIDALGNPLRIAQFDGRIHAPEGSWLTWPWAYGALMAVLAKALLALTGAADPMTVLAFIAPAGVFVNAALLLAICRRLGLSAPMQALAMLFFATLPLTQNLHRTGTVDHHWAEYTFVLATIWLGLAWFEDLSSRRRAIALAVVLGAAPAFQNGLFILQLPALLSVGWLWATRRALDRRAALAFAVALVASTAAFLLPSDPFRNGEFSYYLHSWFHLYVAGCTALLCVLASRFRAAPLAAAVLCALLAAMGVAILPQLELGGDFLFTRIPFMERMAETRSIAHEVASGRGLRVTVNYSPLLWLLPLGLGGLAWRLRRDASNARIYFFVQALFGSFLLLQTLRFHYFGSFALILPICQLIDDARDRQAVPFASRARAVALSVVIVAVIVAGPLGRLGTRYLLANDYWYVYLRHLYPVLAQACREGPGVVLAHHQDGHFIRYHTECSVIGNNFLTTPQHIQKVWFSEDLLAGSLADVLRQAPYVRYILVRRADDVLDAARTCGLLCPENEGLRRELLQPEAPERLRLLMDLRLQIRGQPVTLARLFEVVRP
jgi:hypothetical protein